MNALAPRSLTEGFHGLRAPEFDDEEDATYHQNVAADLKALVDTVYGQAYPGRPKDQWAAIRSDKRAALFAFLADEIEQDTADAWSPVSSAALQSIYAGAAVQA